MSGLSPAQIQALTPVEIQGILDGPSALPPMGVKQNFVNPANWDIYVLITITLASTFSTVAVAIRCYTKLRIIRKWGLEDYSLVLGWMFAVSYLVIITITHYKGRGVHQWNLSVREFEKLLYWVNICEILYNPAIFFTKLSILLLYFRVFVNGKRENMVVYFGIWALILSNLICYTVDTFFTIFICTPREKIWNVLYADGGHCFNQDKSIESLGIFNSISDFVMLFLPVVSIWRLQMPQRRKIGLIGIFGLGFFGCITAIIRTVYTFDLVNSSDVSWNINAMGCWTVAEIAIGLICASLPVFPKFLQNVREKWTILSSRNGGTSGISLSRLSRPSKPRSNNKAIRNWDDDSCLRTYDVLEEGGGTQSTEIDTKSAYEITKNSTVV